jgi:hypothetical protein
MCVSINKHLMRFQNCFCILSRLSQGEWLNPRTTNCASALTGITQVGFKYVTLNCKHLDGESEFRFYIFSITFLITTILSHDSP